MLPGGVIKRIWTGVAAALLAAASAQAAPPVVFRGFLDDAGNAAMVGSGPAPSPPLFGDDLEIANNVAVHALSIPTAGAVRFDSNGFSAGGVDPYFTLFAGNGAGATFFASNYEQAFATGGDFDFTLSLAAGDYLVALGAFANMSIAENYGAGTLGEGFVGLGEPAALGSTYYELVVSTADVQPIPEPPALLLLATGLVGLASFGGRRRADA